MKYFASPFLHTIVVSEEHVALYNSLTLEVAFLEKSFLAQCRKGNEFISFDGESERIFSILEEISLLNKEGDDGYGLFHSYRKALEKPSINILYLLLTDSCNFRCKYCYFLANMDSSYHFSFMSEETAISAVDMFARCIQKSITEGHDDQQIVIYGGEPTINKKTLIAVLKYIVNIKHRGTLPSRVSITLNTNGTLLDEEILNACKETNVVVAISIDGPKEIHDQMRVYTSGRGTFDDVVRNYRKARSLGVKTGLCVTIDKHNLFELQNITHWISDDLKSKGVGFNILIDYKGDDSLSDREKYTKIVASQIIKCFIIARDNGLYEDRMMRRVKNFVEKTPVLSDCGGCGLQIVISPDGKIGVCQGFCGTKNFFVSESFETFNPEEHQYWKEWRKRSPLSMEECRECIALGNCGGGCPYNAFAEEGTIWALDKRFCIHAKTTTEFLIKDLWEKQKED